MKRRLFIMLMAVTVLLGAGAIVVEAVLHSEYPRTLTVQQLQRQTGLMWSIGSQQSGWSGHSTLRDVEVRSPMESRPLLRADRITVEHTPLLRMPASGLKLERLVVDGAAVEIVQEANGTTNLQRAMETIAASRARGTFGGASTNAELPVIDVARAAITLTNADGVSRTIDSTSLRGRSADSLTWQFTLDLPGAAEFNGRLVSGGLWRHEVEFSARDLGAFEHMLGSDLARHLQTLHGAGTWTGQRRGNSVIGRLALASMQGSFGSATGSLGIRADESSITVEDLAVQLRSDALDNQAIFITGGPMTVTSERVRFDRVHVRDATFDAELVAHGEWNHAARVGTVQANWQAFHPAIMTRHTGSIDATIDAPSLGDARINALLETRGNKPDLGSWDVRANLDARGRTHEHAGIQVLMEKLRLERKGQSLDLDGTLAAIDRSGSLLTIRRITVPGYHSSTSGSYELANHAWSLSLALRQWVAPAIDHVPRLGPVDVRVIAHGDLEQVFVTELEAVAPHARCAGSGSYIARANPPFEADLHLTLRPDAQWSITPPLPAPSVSATERPADPATLASLLASMFSAPQPNSQWARRSEIKVRTSMSGSLAPLSLLAGGEVHAADVPLWNDSLLPRVQSDISVHLSETMATISADVRDLFGGVARIEAEFDHHSREVQANVFASDISASHLTDLLEADLSVQGRAMIEGQARAHVEHLSNVAFAGHWSIDKADIANQPMGTVRGKIAVDGQVARVTDIEARRDDGSTLRGQASLDLEAGVLEAEFNASAWLAQAPELSSMTLDADIGGQVNIRSGTIDARAHVTGAANMHDGPTLPLVVRAEISDNLLQIHQAELMLLGGIASATGELRIDDLRSARGEITWSGIELSRVSELWPGASNIPEQFTPRGTLGGAMKIHPAADPRALEPTHASITLLPADASVGAMTLNQSTFTMHLGPTRAVIDASHLELADGSIDAWAQLSWAHDGPFAQLQASFANLNLDQIVRTIDMSSPPVPGRLDGRLAIGGYVQSPHRAFGQSELTVRESDVANVPLISVLYRTMNLRIDEPKPEGEGNVRARLDGDSLDITRLTYFNRGVDVVSLLRIDNVWQGANSPINGFAIGALRPLKQVDLPVIRDIDKAMKVLQAGAGSVRISGTVGEHEIKAVPFEEIAGVVRSALRGL